MKKYWFWLFLCYIVNINGHIFLNNCADRVGVANINLLSTSPNCAYYNPSLFNPGIATSISQPFGLSGIENGNITYASAIYKANVSLGVNYLLSDNYQQYSNFLSISYQLCDILTIGLSEKLITVYEYTNYKKWMTDVGILIKKDRLALAIAYTNLLHTPSAYLDMPNVISTEIAYSLSENSICGIALEKESNYALNSKIALRYALDKYMSVSSGYSFQPNQMFVGIILSYKQFSTNYAISTHLELGLTHYVSLKYEL